MTFLGVRAVLSRTDAESGLYFGYALVVPHYPVWPLARPVLFAAHLLRHDLFVLVEAAFELAAWREDLHDPYGPWARVKEGVGYAPRLDDVGAFLGEHDLAAYTARSSQSHVSTRTV